jgi:hypothetical protein
MTDRALAPLKEIPYLDHPELKFNEHESTEMPFRYVKSEEGKPIMPDVSDFIPTLVSDALHSPDNPGHGGFDQEGFRQGNR